MSEVYNILPLQLMKIHNFFNLKMNSAFKISSYIRLFVFFSLVVAFESLRVKADIVYTVKN